MSAPRPGNRPGLRRFLPFSVAGASPARSGRAPAPAGQGRESAVARHPEAHLECVFDGSCRRRRAAFPWGVGPPGGRRAPPAGGGRKSRFPRFPVPAAVDN
ncbi:hypothetical protein GCM10010295_53580 [Streptomyces intermedius]